MKIRTDTMDGNIVEEMNRDVYYAKKCINNHDIIIDAGANIGAFAAFVKGFAPHIKIVCIEPMPSNIEILRDNLKEKTTCTIINAALMGTSGICTLYDLGGKSSACHSIYSLGVEDSHEVSVPSITIKEVVENNNLEKIDFLKLDVQGAEYEIILNTPSFILGMIKYISMEMHSSISNTEKVLGSIPNYKRNSLKTVRKLSKSHIAIQHNSSMWLWINKSNANKMERAHSEIIKLCWYISIWVQQFYKSIKSIIPKQILSAIQKLIKRR